MKMRPIAKMSYNLAKIMKKSHISAVLEISEIKISVNDINYKLSYGV